MEVGAIVKASIINLKIRQCFRSNYQSLRIIYKEKNWMKRWRLYIINAIFLLFLAGCQAAPALPTNKPLERVNDETPAEELIHFVVTREQQSQIYDRISEGEEITIEDVDAVMPIECLRIHEEIEDVYYSVHASEIQGKRVYGYILYQKEGDELKADAFYDPYYVSPESKLGWIEPGKTTFREIRAKLPGQELYYGQEDQAIVSEYWDGADGENYYVIVYQGEITEEACTVQEIVRKDWEPNFLGFVEKDISLFLGEDVRCLDASQTIPESLYIREPKDTPISRPGNF